MSFRGASSPIDSITRMLHQFGKCGTCGARPQANSDLRDFNRIMQINVFCNNGHYYGKVLNLLRVDVRTTRLAMNKLKRFWNRHIEWGRQ